MEKIRNSIQGLEQGKSSQKIGYAILLILGIFFFVASVSTLYSLFSLIQKNNQFSDIYAKKYVLGILYIVLNFIVGYGLVFCKRWIIPLFGINALLMGTASLYSYFFEKNIVTAGTTLIACSVSFVFFLITYLFKSILNDSYYKKTVDAVYIILLLITFILTYFI